MTACHLRDGQLIIQFRLMAAALRRSVVINLCGRGTEYIYIYIYIGVVADVLVVVMDPC